MRKWNVYFSLVLSLFIFIFFFILCILNGGLQKRQVIVTSLGRCCRHSGGVPPRVPIVGVPATCGKRWRRVRWMMTWLRRLSVCGTWAEEMLSCSGNGGGGSGDVDGGSGESGVFRSSGGGLFRSGLFYGGR